MVTIRLCPLPSASLLRESSHDDGGSNGGDDLLPPRIQRPRRNAFILPAHLRSTGHEQYGAAIASSEDEGRVFFLLHLHTLFVEIYRVVRQSLVSGVLIWPSEVMLIEETDRDTGRLESKSNPWVCMQKWTKIPGQNKKAIPKKQNQTKSSSGTEVTMTLPIATSSCLAVFEGRTHILMSCHHRIALHR